MICRFILSLPPLHEKNPPIEMSTQTERFHRKNRREGGREREGKEEKKRGYEKEVEREREGK